MAKDKPVALVVGAGDYIGAAIARRFAAGGFQVCLARRTGDALRPLVEQIETGGGTAHAFATDARVDTAWVRSRIKDRGGDPDQFPADALMKPESVAEA